MAFDYKLIIILGLSIVIYFIYKEVDALYDRLVNLEEKVNQYEFPKSHEISDNITTIQQDDNSSKKKNNY